MFTRVSQNDGFLASRPSIRTSSPPAIVRNMRPSIRERCFRSGRSLTTALVIDAFWSELVVARRERDAGRLPLRDEALFLVEQGAKDAPSNVAGATFGSDFVLQPGRDREVGLDVEPAALPAARGL